MACCKPFVGSVHHPFCKNNLYVVPIENSEFSHVEQGTQYRVYNPDVIMDWTLKNLGRIMAMNGRPLSLADGHVFASLETASKIVTSHVDNQLTGFAILEPKTLTMRNKYKSMIGEIVVHHKNDFTNHDAITVSVIYAVPGHGCDLMGFLRSIVPLKRVLALEAVKGSERFSKRIGMTKYGEEQKHRTHLFVCERSTFFPDVKVVYAVAKRTLVYPFPAGFDEHMLELAKKPLDTLRFITGCPVPEVPVVHKTVSVFRTVPTCDKCHAELCLCDLDPDDFGDLPMPEAAFSFAAADEFHAILEREAEESRKRAAEFSKLLASTASARQSVTDAESNVAAVKQRAVAARAAAAAAHKAAEVASELARKAENEEQEASKDHAAAIAASATVLQLLQVEVGKKRARE